jgi:uncharacterized membrane protein required for colicin V production
MWYDILAVAILAFTTIRGAMKGVIWQIAAIAGLVCCFVFSESISAAAGPYVKLDPPLNNWVVMIGAYLLFSLASFSIAKLLTEWLDKIHFGDFNRHLGAIFGFVKGALIVLVITFFSVTVSKSMHDVLKTSRTGHIAALVMFHLHPVMPEKLHDTLARYINIHTLDDPDLQKKYEERQLHAGHDHDDEHGDDLPPADGNQLILPPDFEKILSELPPDRQEEFKSLMMRSLQTTKEPEAKVDLLDSLWNVLTKVRNTNDVTSLMETLKQPSANVKVAVSDWLTQPSALPAATGDILPEPPPAIPEDSPAPMPAVASSLPEAAPKLSLRDELLDRVSGEFSSATLARTRIRRDIENQLKDVPDEVAVSALEDWLTDLEIARQGQGGRGMFDPNPSTNATTSLRARIDQQTAQDLPATGSNGRLQ